MKKWRPMVAPGWMSMPVRVWAYSVTYARHHRQAAHEQFVGDAVGADRLDGGVAQENFLHVARRGVALVGRAQILGEHFAQRQKRLEKIQHQLVGAPLALSAVARLAALARALAEEHVAGDALELLRRSVKAFLRERHQMPRRGRVHLVQGGEQRRFHRFQKGDGARAQAVAAHGARVHLAQVDPGQRVGQPRASSSIHCLSSLICYRFHRRIWPPPDGSFQPSNRPVERYRSPPSGRITATAPSTSFAARSAAASAAPEEMPTSTPSRRAILRAMA